MAIKKYIAFEMCIEAQRLFCMALKRHGTIIGLKYLLLFRLLQVHTDGEIYGSQECSLLLLQEKKIPLNPMTSFYKYFSMKHFDGLSFD